MSVTPVSSSADRPSYSPRNPLLRAVLVVLAAALIVLFRAVSSLFGTGAFAAASFTGKQKSPTMTPIK